MENAKIQKFKCDILGDFQTLCKGREIKTSTCPQGIQQRQRVTAGGAVIQVESKAKEGHDLESRRASSRGLIPKAKVKTIKMTFVIISVFILCWSPYIVFDLLQVYG